MLAEAGAREAGTGGSEKPDASNADLASASASDAGVTDDIVRTGVGIMSRSLTCKTTNDCWIKKTPDGERPSLRPTN
jgi:hypothetical protein